MKVKVQGLGDAKRLADACSMCDCAIDAVTGSRNCDAKSVLGIMSLDLTSEIELQFQCEPESKESYIKIIEENF